MIVPARAEVVRFRSADGDPVLLVGDYSPPAGPQKPFLILLHGLGSGRGEWQPLVHLARSRGWGTLAYDLRGHADSRRTVSGREVDHSVPAFGRDPAFWRSFVADLSEAAQFARARGVPAERLFYVGASLGANVCLLAAEEREPAGIVLLSPGFEYAGLRAEAAMPRIRAPALLVAAEPDRYAFASAERLAELSRGRADTILLERGGPAGAHGTQMFDGGLEKRILDWVGKVSGNR